MDGAQGQREASLGGPELIGRFRRQANLMHKRKFYSEAQDAILDVVTKEYDSTVKGFSREGIAPGNEIEDIEIFRMPVDSVYVPPNLSRPVSEHVIGLFPSRKIECFIGDMKWILRVRASITACALKRPSGLPKLWWTFEGIPADPDPLNRPSEDQAADFISATNEMAERAIPKLCASYRDALFNEKEGYGRAFDLLRHRICINMSDNNGELFAELLDAMNIRGASFSEVSHSESYGANARVAAEEFKAFVKDVTGAPAPFDDTTVKIHAEIAGLKALIYQYEHEDPKRHEIILAGLSRSSGARGGYAAVSNEQKRVENGEGYVRSTSAARPISAMLASREAILLDDKLSAG